MKQQLVSIDKPLHTHCGFNLCPKKFKYLANPTLLDKIFSSPNPRVENIHKVKRPRHLSKVDTMHTTNCSICNEEYLLRIDNPICTSCRRFY